MEFLKWQGSNHTYNHRIPQTWMYRVFLHLRSNKNKGDIKNVISPELLVLQKFEYTVEKFENSIENTQPCKVLISFVWCGVGPMFYYQDTTLTNVNRTPLPLMTTLKLVAHLKTITRRRNGLIHRSSEAM